MPLSLMPETSKVRGEGAVPALSADILTLVVLLVLAVLVLGLDGEDALLQVQGDVLFMKAGQLSLQQELVALVPDVGPEGGQGGVGCC